MYACGLTILCMYAFYPTIMHICMYVNLYANKRLYANSCMYECIFVIFDRVCMKCHVWNPPRAPKICVDRRAVEKTLRQGPTPLREWRIPSTPQRDWHFGQTPLSYWRWLKTPVSRFWFVFAIFYSILTSFRTRTSPDFIN